MKKIIASIAVVAAVAMTGCTRVETVDPGYVGKVISNSGVHPELYETGRHRLDDFGRDQERMIKIDVSSVLRKAPVTVIMADFDVDEAGNKTQRIGLDMDFLVNLRYRLRNDENTINSMLKDMTLDRGVNLITAEQIYNKYGNMIVGRVSREVLGQYTPEEVLDNLDLINKTLDQKINQAFQATPLIASSVSLGPIQLPPVITDRIQKNKDTELKEAERRAQQKIDLLDKQNEIELARQQAVREKIDAQSAAEQNRILAESASPSVIKLRELDIRKQEIEMMREALTSGSASSIFIPYGAIDNTGAQMRMFQQ